MSETKHAPGPWTVEEYGYDDPPALVIHTDEIHRVCFMATPGSMCDPETIEANANLIAAAPDLHSHGTFLLERLNDFEREIQDDELAREWSGHVMPAIARFSAAIAKAEGRS